MFSKNIRRVLLGATVFAFAFAVGPVGHFGPFSAAYASKDTGKAEADRSEKGTDKSKEAKEAGDNSADKSESSKDNSGDTSHDSPADR